MIILVEKKGETLQQTLDKPELFRDSNNRKDMP